MTTERPAATIAAPSPAQALAHLADGGTPEITVRDLLHLARAYQWLIVGSALVVGAALATQAYLQPRSYTATASFMPQGSSGGSAGGLGGIAAQLGIAAGVGLGNDSPALYVELLKSRGVLGAVADSTFPEANGRDPRALSAQLGVVENDPEIRRALTVEALRGMLEVQPSRETGVVHLSITAPSRSLGAAILSRLIDQVAEFNLRQRQAQAARERRFVEERLEVARQELRAAEQRLGAFMSGNRQYQGSPSLAFEQNRLQQEVATRQQTVASMMLAFEQARLEEVRDQPRITIIEPAAPPLRANPRGTVRKGTVGAALGATLGVLLALGLEARRRARGD